MEKVRVAAAAILKVEKVRVAHPGNDLVLRLRLDACLHYASRKLPSMESFSCTPARIHYIWKTSLGWIIICVLESVDSTPQAASIYIET